MASTVSTRIFSGIRSLLMHVKHFCKLILRRNEVHHSYVTFPPHVTSTSAIEKGKWLEWRDTPERTDSSGSNGPVEPDLDLDKRNRLS
jgi:hypothetical protein